MLFGSTLSFAIEEPDLKWLLSWETLPNGTVILKFENDVVFLHSMRRAKPRPDCNAINVEPNGDYRLLTRSDKPYEYIIVREPLMFKSGEWFTYGGKTGDNLNHKKVCASYDFEKNVCKKWKPVKHD